jgi:hypothetical protein
MAMMSTATERMEAARNAKRSAIGRELLLVSLLSRFWPSHLAPPRTPQVNFAWIVCVHSPAGQLVWRVSNEELPLFAHLEERENHGKDYIGGEKEALMLLLATTREWE